MMNWNDYKEAVKADAIEAIKENASWYGDWDAMIDGLFFDDSVTGNASGSYTFCTQTAAENVAGIIFDEDALEAFSENGYDGIPTKLGPESCDVIARCIALGEIVYTDEFEAIYNAEREKLTA